MTRLSEKGFTIVEAALIGVIVLALGGIGWFVYSKSQTQDETSQPQSSTNVPVASENSTDKEAEEANADATNPIPGGWVKYTNKAIGFSFAYPEEWGAVSENTEFPEKYWFYMVFSKSDVKFCEVGESYQHAGRDGTPCDFDDLTTNTEKYTKISGFNTDGMIYKKYDNFGAIVTHLIMETKDEEYPVINFHVSSSDVDSKQFEKLASTFEVL